MVADIDDLAQLARGASFAHATSVRSKDALLRLGQDWDDLYERVNCSAVFLSHDWMAEWWEQFAADHRGNTSSELFVIAVREPGGRLIAVAPFYIRRAAWFGARVLAFMASTGVASDHLDVLVEPGVETESIREIVRLVLAERKRWDYIELADADADSLVFANLRQQLKEAGLSEHLTQCPERPYAQLPLSFDEFLSGLGSSVRYNFRRRLRNLERAGAFQFLCLTDNAEIQERFGDLLRLHGRRFDQLGKTSAFLEQRLQAFHSGLLNRVAARPWPRLYLLQVDHKTVASLYGFSVGKRFSFYQSGMDPEWAKFSVGLVMLGCSIQHCIQSGDQEFDFLRGTPAYKLLWTKGSRQAITSRFFDGRPRSRAALAKFALRVWASRLKRSLKARLRKGSNVPDSRPA